MITPNADGMMRVTLTLPPEDVHLLDRLAHFEGSNRSAEIRGLLLQVRPMLQQLVQTFTVAEQQRENLDQALLNATVSDMQAILPEAEDLNRRFIGMVAKFEGAATARRDGEAPASNTGATE
jgi:hypothetical protein